MECKIYSQNIGILSYLPDLIRKCTQNNRTDAATGTRVYPDFSKSLIKL